MHRVCPKHDSHSGARGGLFLSQRVPLTPGGGTNAPVTIKGLPKASSNTLATFSTKSSRHNFSSVNLQWLLLTSVRGAKLVSGAGAIEEGAEVTGSRVLNDRGILFLIAEREAVPEVSREVFDAVDTDQDGFITLEEVSDLLTKAGRPIPAEILTALFAEADADKDGKISFQGTLLRLFLSSHSRSRLLRFVFLSALRP